MPAGKLLPRLLRPLVAVLALCSARAAQCELQFIVPPEPPPSNGRGWMIAQAGATFAVAGNGGVHIYEQDGLTAYLVQELLVPDFVPHYTAIAALAFDGENLALTVSDGRSSAVRVYERRAGEWVLATELLPGPRAIRFGLVLALDGARLVVSASEDYFPQSLAVAYVYERAGGQWTRVDRLAPPPERIFEGFGHSLDLEGDRLAVGVAGPATSPEPTHAYVFEHTAAGWERHEVVSARPSPYGFRRLDLRGDTLLISATSTTAGGMARVFEHDGVAWRETGELVSPEAVDSPRCVALADPDLALVAAPRNSQRKLNGGAVYVFERVAGTWQQIEKLFPSSPAFWQGFGESLACEDGLAVLGAMYGEGVRTFSVRETACRTLSAYPHEVSLTLGGRQTLRLDPGREHVGRTYLLLGSASGFDPGFRLRGARVPLVPDAYLACSLPGRRRAPFVNSVGVLGTRQAVVTLDVPAGLDLALAGLTLHHAFVVLERGVVKHVSNFRTLTLVP